MGEKAAEEDKQRRKTASSGAALDPAMSFVFGAAFRCRRLVSIDGSDG